jgi:chemotaxis protein MotC
MTAPPAATGAGAAPRDTTTPSDPVSPVGDESNRQAAADAAGLPPVEGVESERPAAEAAPPAAMPAKVETTAGPPSAAPTPAVAAADTAAAQPIDPADRIIAETKRKLDKIDQLLGASPQ